MLKITLVASPGCAVCETVKAILERMKNNYPDMEVEKILMTTPEGQELVKKHNIVASPGVIINDQLFKMGMVTEEEFKQKFDELKNQSAT